MSIPRHGLLAFRHAAASLRDWLLPVRCLLCGAAGDGGIDLCAGCVAELPRNSACCARCALPLPAGVAVCGECQRHAPPWHAAWAPFRYGWPLDRLESRYKFAGDLAAGRALAACWVAAPLPLEQPQLIVPVPLHPRRLRSRGYNQALELAKPVARACGVPLRTDVLERVRHTAAQSRLDAPARRRNLRHAFRLRPGVTLPAHVAVLDDVMTTGATLAECVRTLRRAGVARVDVWALARVPSAAGR